MSRPICRHCNRKEANRPRGLCWQCYYTPGVRALYPVTSKFARRGVATSSANRLQSPASTAAPPGTAAKIAVMMERALQGFAVFHEDDAKLEPQPIPWTLPTVRMPRKWASLAYKKLCATEQASATRTE